MLEVRQLLGSQCFKLLERRCARGASGYLSRQQHKRRLSWHHLVRRRESQDRLGRPPRPLGKTGRSGGKEKQAHPTRNAGTNLNCEELRRLLQSSCNALGSGGSVAASGSQRPPLPSHTLGTSSFLIRCPASSCIAAPPCPTSASASESRRTHFCAGRRLAFQPFCSISAHSPCPRRLASSFSRATCTDHGGREECICTPICPRRRLLSSSRTRRFALPPSPGFAPSRHPDPRLPISPSRRPTIDSTLALRQPPRSYPCCRIANPPVHGGFFLGPCVWDSID